MRYLGVDYGKRRIGLALSDPEGKIAFPHGVVGHLSDVVALARTEGVGEIVVGLPRSSSGADTVEARSVRTFAAKLQSAVELPIAFEDERLTTKLARRHTPEANVDASAAALILQSYLDRIKPEELDPKR